MIWLPGAERKSKRLEAVVGEKRTFDLSSFFLGTSDENPQVPTTNYWDKEIIEPICEDFAEIRHYYLHDKGYEVFMRKQQNDYEKFLRAQYEEFERRLDDDA